VTADPAEAQDPDSTPKLGDPGPFLAAAKWHYETYSSSKSPAELVIAGLTVLGWYRWWLWYAVGKLDPLAISEDNMMTRTRRVEIRARSLDAKAANRLLELGSAAHKLRNKLFHVDPHPPAANRISMLIDAAGEFSDIVEQVVSAHALPKDPNEQATYINATLYIIFQVEESLRGHYPDDEVDAIMEPREALDGVARAWNIPEMAEPLMILVRELERNVDSRASAMYSVCPKCRGQMFERTWEETVGGTEQETVPTLVNVWTEVKCKDCGHVVVHAPVADYSS
jgi:predicted nucleic-acid-binding Zn-ribbon protein